MCRAFVCCLALLVAFTTPASALSLRWSGDHRDLQAATARACTLLVQVSSSAEALPAEWRLIWVARSDDDAPFEIQTLVPDGAYADVCEHRPAASITSIVARVDTVLYCAAGGRPGIARYVSNVAAGTNAKIKLVAPGLVDTTSDSLEVTINGGVSDPYPPVISFVEGVALPGELSLQATGVNLATIERGALVDNQTGTELNLDIAIQESGFIALSSDAQQLPPVARLELHDRSGAVTALPFESATMVSLGNSADDRIIIRFQPGAAAPPAGSPNDAIASFAFSPPALGSALSAVGLERLERLFPWFNHEDVETTNAFGEPVHLEDIADYYIGHLTAGAEPSTVIPLVRALDGVLHAEADIVLRPSMVPNDPLFPLQWGLRNTGQNLCGRPAIGGADADIGATFAWDHTLGSPSASVAILDTGIDNTHVDLAQNTILDTAFVDYTTSAFDDDQDRHGTAVAGLVGAASNNQVGVSGVAPHTTLHAIKVLAGGACGAPAGGYLSWFAQGIEWARYQGIRVINASLGTPSAGIVPEESLSVLRVACLNAYLSGALIVAAAGNIRTLIDGPTGFTFEQPWPVYPACYSRRVLA
ncbi:MAG: hypothetical protein E4H28_08110, partial [Gemmatimonadales bacterium]